MKEERFYIQHKGYVGNCLLWWRKDGSGYAVDLKDAWNVSKKQVAAICTSRPQEDIPWPVELANSVAQRHVTQPAERLRAAIQSPEPPQESRPGTEGGKE